MALHLAGHAGDLAYRLGLRVAGGSARWHNRDFPPSLALHCSEREVELCRDGAVLRLQWFSTLDGGFDGRCHVVLSGPSVGRIGSPERLGSCFGFWANGSPALAETLGLQPSMYVVSDPGFAARRHGELLRHCERAERYLVSFGCAARLLGAAPSDRRGYVFDSPERPFRAAVGAANASHPGFALNQLVSGGTVALICVNAALRMGFKEIVMFGLDLTDQPRFFDAADAEPSRLMGDMPMIVAGFRNAMRDAEARGARIVNCSPGTALDSRIVPHGDPEAWL